jgi:hypothetical protein
MPMSLDGPVVSQISDEIFTRLETMVAGANGPYEFAGVMRPTKLATYTPEHLLIVQTRGESVRVPDLDCPGNPPAIAMQQTFLIRVHIAPSERDPQPVEFYEDIAEAEIQKAICYDQDTWHTFGGNAINAMFGSIQTVTSDGGYDGISIPLDVTYRYSEGDPYEVRA